MGAPMNKAKEQPAKQPATAATLREVLNDVIANSATRINLAAILQTTKSQGIPITWREVEEVANLRRGDALVTPSFITDFLVAYGRTSVRRILATRKV